MPVWEVSSIDDEPEVELTRWRILQTGEGTRHFVGAEFDGSGRVSSAIQEFDPATLTGRTSSGRVYKLVGVPGSNSNAEYVWKRWCYINKVVDATEVSTEVLEA